MSNQWTTPKTWVSEPLTATDLNTHVRDNLEFLKDPPTAYFNADNVSNYQTTQSSFTAVDSTNFKLSITPAGDTVLLAFFGAVTINAAGAVFFDVLVDNTTYLGGNDGLVIAHLPANDNQVTTTSFVYVLDGLTAGIQHTFELHWKTSAGTASLFAGAGTSQRDLIPQFWVREVS